MYDHYEDMAEAARHASHLETEFGCRVRIEVEGDGVWVRTDSDLLMFGRFRFVPIWKFQTMEPGLVTAAVESLGEALAAARQPLAA